MHCCNTCILFEAYFLPTHGIGRIRFFGKTTLVECPSLNLWACYVYSTFLPSLEFSKLQDGNSIFQKLFMIDLLRNILEPKLGCLYV
jgi:hypothetical protein